MNYTFEGNHDTRTHTHTHTQTHMFQYLSFARDYTVFSWSISPKPHRDLWSPNPSLDSFFAMSFCAAGLECLKSDTCTHTQGYIYIEYISLYV